ncbi:uncharacterized protein LOC107636733 [Arachis ipaensis]|uniref:uncharacterized protein LOC107636733 n=1 Tax=Arachis ipaensis TaxID=130454 RepID=UPI000A2B3766|nr:uncharacterized protein LOC107636733 [Arachis ipaensis]
MMEEQRECVAEQGGLARVRSVATTVTPCVATTVAPCVANFVAPRHHHRRRTIVESLPSYWRCELLSSHKQPDAKRERQNNARREKRRCMVVSAAGALSAIAVCGARHRQSHELKWRRRPSSLCCCSHQSPCRYCYTSFSFSLIAFWCCLKFSELFLRLIPLNSMLLRV